MTATISQRMTKLTSRAHRRRRLQSISERVLVVVPTYCEGANIVSILARVRAAVPGADVLVVDDHSPDETASSAERLGYHLGHITVIQHTGESGPTDAYRTGFEYGMAHDYDLLMTMAPDRSSKPRQP